MFPANMESTWEDFPATLIISGGGIIQVTMGTIKRKLKELMSITHLVVASVRAMRRPPLSFYDDEILDIVANFVIPLLVQAYISNFDVRKIILD